MSCPLESAGDRGAASFSLSAPILHPIGSSIVKMRAPSCPD